MEKTTAKGATLLKVTGIIMIIGSALSFIISIVAIVGIAQTIRNPFLTVSAVAVTAVIIAPIHLLIEFITGIVGVKNCKRPEKASTCITWGVLSALSCILVNLLTISSGGSFSAFSVILGLVLPVLFIIGAVQNKQES